jgi:ethanolamine phosphate phosphodiesterase
MRITDNYMRKSYKQLQKTLHPDTVMFLGDLFDGGREWKTAHGDFEDPDWAKEHRPANEKKFLEQWHRNYGEQYWLKEYARFGRIFFDNWILGGTKPSPYQRGRKIIASLPGNHDLGFGAEVKVPVRQRFIAYFGETNRVDIIGNHTFVSVDTVSLSADTSRMKDRIDLSEIYDPVNDFLGDVKAIKRRAVQKELRFWRAEAEEVAQEHKVEELESADYSHLPTLDPGEDGPEFPTILLSHVPLYREPGTPCGPLREHWPPAKPPKGQSGPMIPDHRNAISVSSGYQYQNVLNEEDSIKLIKSIGNVKHAFSGDDHDYCEIIHSPLKENVREITVKSFSMAMGVPTPGFQMVSLYNPIDNQGKPLPGSPSTTLQTHLCLLPNQLSMFVTYAVLGVLTILVLVARAFLLPILKLQPFSLEPTKNAPSAVLPVFKAKDDAEEETDFDRDSTSAATSASNSTLPSARFSSSTARTRAAPPSPYHAHSNSSNSSGSSKTKTTKGGKAGPGKWGWGQSSRGPRIQIRRDTYYYDEKMRGGDNAWRPASRQRHGLGLIVTEIWTTCWRTAWMVLLFYAWLTYRG